jgi:hypothetical protein
MYGLNPILFRKLDHSKSLDIVLISNIQFIFIEATKLAGFFTPNEREKRVLIL